MNADGCNLILNEKTSSASGFSMRVKSCPGNVRAVLRSFVPSYKQLG
jgi:hypothetical protein